MIILEKVREKEKLSKGIIDTTALAEVTRISSFYGFARKYIWVINNVNLDAAKE